MSTGRRTWDKEHYEQLAKERLANGDQQDAGSSKGVAASKNAAKEEFRAAETGAAGPMGSQRAFIKSREQKIDLESKVGKTEIINPTAAGNGRGAGFWCEVCECLLKDSVAYLDHINGKKHQRALGFSMRSERSDVSSVKEKLESLKRKATAVNAPRAPAIDDYEKRMAAQILEKIDVKKRRKEEAEERKKQQKNLEAEQVAAAVADAPVVDMDPDMAAIMGFGGFGGSKKK